MTTRSMTVTVNPIVMPETPYLGFDVDGGTGDPSNVDVLTTAERQIDQLTYSTASSFTSRAQNASPANGGWSDMSPACSGTTLVLAVSVPSHSVTTRSITANATATNGNATSLTLEGVYTHGDLSDFSFPDNPSSTRGRGQHPVHADGAQRGWVERGCAADDGHHGVARDSWCANLHRHGQ